MNRLIALSRLPRPEVAALAVTFPVMLLVRLLLTLLPVRLWASLLRDDLSVGVGAGWRLSDDTLLQAVRRASGYVPGASCLTQALTAHLLLASTARSSVIRLGVRRSPTGSLDAHAWLEIDGCTRLGAPPAGVVYTPLDTSRLHAHRLTPGSFVAHRTAK